mgnify:CR=1 FL=1
MDTIKSALQLLKNKDISFKKLRRSTTSNGVSCVTPKECDHEVTINEKIGSGAFGTVFKGTYRNEIVAIKREELSTETKQREINILKYLDKFPNNYVVRMVAYNVESKNNVLTSHIIFEYYPYTLTQYLTKIVSHHMLFYLRKIFCHIAHGLKHIHQHNICHRDIKGDNILLKGNGKSTIAVIADFGSAKQIEENRESTSYITTRYYRAPECILLNPHYNHKIDIWSAGCVFAECILQEPIFKGDDNTDQLCKIFKIIGFPDTDCLLKLNPELDTSNDMILKVKEKEKFRLTKILRKNSHNLHISTMLESVITNMLNINPEERLDASEILKLPYFKYVK